MEIMMHNEVIQNVHQSYCPGKTPVKLFLICELMYL